MRYIRFNSQLFAALLLLLFMLPSLALAERKTVLTISGEPQYQWNGEYFSHVNPDAPKGGTLWQGEVGSFDSMNPFISRGVPAGGLGLTFDTLGDSPPDYSTFEYYGLIAESFEVPADNSSVTFYLNPAARFHDGSPITAEDVAFSYELLTTKGAPSYRQYYRSVAGVDILDTRTVRFNFSEKNNNELPAILMQLPVLSKQAMTPDQFEKPGLNTLLGSGAYKVKRSDPGKYIEYERVKDYWAADLPVNKGRYNFDTIRYEYYRDRTVSRQAFKGGEFDFFAENTAKSWANDYKDGAVARGLIKMEELDSNRTQGMSAFMFNTRRSVFADKRVRRALTLAFDFEWTNRTIFYGSYAHSYSYFTNSEFAAEGLPTKEELAILEPYRGQISDEVFTTVYQPPRGKGDGNIRPRLKQALQLFKQAGWTLKKRKLVNDAGEQLRFTVMIDSKTFNRILLPLKKNFQRMGVDMEIALVDQTQYVNRVRSFDYDMILASYPQSSSPGNELRYFWSSHAAETEGSRNYSGIKSPVIDELIERIIASPDREQLKWNCRAIDRVLLWEDYVIPGWYFSKVRIAYWDKFVRSDIDPPNGLDIYSWWIDPEREARLREPGIGYNH